MAKLSQVDSDRINTLVMVGTALVIASAFISDWVTSIFLGAYLIGIFIVYGQLTRAEHKLDQERTTKD